MEEPGDTQQADQVSFIWLPGIVACIASFLSEQEIACTLRLVDRATWEQFAFNKVVRVSGLVPTHAFEFRWGRPDSFLGYSFEQRLTLLRLTAATGSVNNLQVALDTVDITFTAVQETLFDAAAEAGRIGVCELLLLRGYPLRARSLEAAARGGHQHACEWLLEAGCAFAPSASYEAARAGHEGLMIWLDAQRRGHRGSAARIQVGKLLEAAAYGLGLEALQRLYQEQKLLPGEEEQQQKEQEQEQGQEQRRRHQPAALIEEQRPRILAAAAGSPTPDWRAKVEWLEGLGYPRTADACTTAANCAALDDSSVWGRLQWLLGRGYPHDGAALTVAASRGHLTALRFLVEQAGAGVGARARVGAGWSLVDAAVPARGGHLAVLQYLHSLGSRIDAHAVAFVAAEGGHLALLAWAVEALGVGPRSNRRDPDGETKMLRRAARGGSVEVLEWLWERGWRWPASRGDSGRCVEVAAARGHQTAVEWLVERRCPWPEHGAAYRSPLEFGDLAMLRCVSRLGCPWEAPWARRVLIDAIRYTQPLPVLRLLVDELGCPVDWGAALGLAWRHKDTAYGAAVMAWLRSERRRRESPGA